MFLISYSSVILYFVEVYTYESLVVILYNKLIANFACILQRQFSGHSIKNMRISLNGISHKNGEGCCYG